MVCAKRLAGAAPELALEAFGDGADGLQVDLRVPHERQADDVEAVRRRRERLLDAGTWDQTGLRNRLVVLMKDGPLPRDAAIRILDVSNTSSTLTFRCNGWDQIKWSVPFSL